MEPALLIAILAGTGGMLGWGLADFFAKKTIDQVGDVVSLAWGHIFGTIVLVAMILFQFEVYSKRPALPGDVQTWVLLLLFGVGQAAVYLLVYRGFAKGLVGVLSPVFASFSGLTAIASIVLLGEVVGPALLAGLVTLFVGILLINVDVQALRSRRLSFAHIPGFKEVAIATVLATFWTLSWDKFIGGQDWLSYTLLMYAFMTFAILVVCFAQRKDIFMVKLSTWKFLFLIGLCETVAYVAISLGYSATPLTSVVALLSGAFSLPTIILARLFLKEKITFTQTIGSLITIGGIMLLVAL